MIHLPAQIEPVPYLPSNLRQAILPAPLNLDTCDDVNRFTVKSLKVRLYHSVTYDINI